MAQSPHSSNHFLASLRKDTMAALLPRLKVVELPQGKVLYGRRDTIKAVYFPCQAVISLIVELASGNMIESAIIGRDGITGGSAAFDNQMISLNKVVVQIAGNASVLEVAHLRALAAASNAFRAKIARHEQFILAQAQQLAACNAVHTLAERLSRWLLRCRDLLHREDIPLTQELLAGVLGVRRTSISIEAQALQEAGLIRYRRGHIHVLDPQGLQRCACECYERLKSQAEELLGWQPG
jgi:CRP-like cAMP-binding protein